VLGGPRFLVPTGLALLGAEYAGALATQESRALLPPVLFASALFLAAEVAYWSLELVTRITREPGILARRLANVGGLVAAGAAAAAIVLAASSAAPGPGLAVELVGVAAAVALVALDARLVRAVFR
jgi:hypothetical protein